jgi:hypothetical protein
MEEGRLLFHMVTQGGEGVVDQARAHCTEVRKALHMMLICDSLLVVDQVISV